MLDQVISEMDTELVATTQAGHEPADRWREIELRLIYDRMTALSERGRHQEVINQYQSLRLPTGMQWAFSRNGTAYCWASPACCRCWSAFG